MTNTNHQTITNLVDSDFSSTLSVVAEVWQNIFGLESVNNDDEFFLFGADSLIASKMLREVGKAFDIEVPITVIFEFPRFYDFCKQVDDIRNNISDGF